MRTLTRGYAIQSEGDVPVGGKFLQLRLADQDFLVLAAATELRYHNQILARFLAEQGVSHRWEGKEHLVVDHPDLTISGGGRFRLTPGRRVLQVWDDSSVYGRFDAMRLAEQLAAAGAPWDQLSLSVD